uniref:Uncharacterized protein n=1 Tax=Romanomermis culicivorax TaxID=13658 RepID=A0A915JQN6_ROMCU
MEMDKQAQMKKKKSLTTLMKPAVPPKYHMKLAPIIARTTTMQALVIGIQTRKYGYCVQKALGGPEEATLRN